MNSNLLGWTKQKRRISSKAPRLTLPTSAERWMSNRPDTNVNTRVSEQPVGDHIGQKIAGQQGEEK